MVQVTRLDNRTFEVRVDGSPPTTHTVHLSPEYQRKLTGGRVSEETLITRSFEFLLERESNTSILRDFDLRVIGRYFPEYENEILVRLG
jgi:hypothetical protein